MSALSMRLHAIVAAVFGGNAEAAARAAETLPSTLHRILEHKVEAPRLSTITKLAGEYGVPLGWLLGEVGSAEAQSGARVTLPEPFWLIRQYFRRRQDSERRWLARVSENIDRSGDPEIQRILSNFSDFQFLPDGTGTALDARLLPVLAAAEPIGQQEVAAYRRFAELETEILGLTVKRLRKLGVRAPDDPPPKTRR